MNGKKCSRSGTLEVPSNGRRVRATRDRRSLHPMPNIAFSLSAAAASLLIAILAAVKGVPVVTAVWAALAVGFVIRAAYGYKRR
jgi:hypothetical protein